MTVKESLHIDLDKMTATTKNGVHRKGVRKIINDHLKENTNLKGGWWCSFEEDDGEQYHYSIYNPYIIMGGGVKWRQK